MNPRLKLSPNLLPNRPNWLAVSIFLGLLVILAGIVMMFFAYRVWAQIKAPKEGIMIYLSNEEITKQLGWGHKIYLQITLPEGEDK